MGKTKAELEIQVKKNRKVIDTQIETLDEYRKTIKNLEFALKNAQLELKNEKKNKLVCNTCIEGLKNSNSLEKGVCIHCKK